MAFDKTVEEGLSDMLADPNRGHPEKLRLSLEFINETERHTFACRLATRCHGGHGKDPRSVQAIVMLRRYLNGSATLAQLQAAAADGWAAFLELEFDPAQQEKAIVANICASAASFYDNWAALVESSFDRLPEQASQVADLTTLVNHGTLPP
jgi:hypothetical protein